MSRFLRALDAAGFSRVRRDESNSHFVLLELRKRAKPGKAAPRWPKLDACIYKRR